jgi:hypothetical protein
LRYDCAPLYEQTTDVDGLSPLKGIKVQPTQAAFYLNTNKVLRANGYVNGDMLVALYDLPGLNYAVEATSPGQAFYVSWEERDKLNAFYLNKVKLAQVPRLFVALKGNEPQLGIVQPEVRKVFMEQGVPFPQSFKLIGRLPAPTDGETVFLYKRN